MPDPSAAHMPGPTSSSSAPLLVVTGLPEGFWSQCVFPGSRTEARAGLPTKGCFPATGLCTYEAATLSSYRQDLPRPSSNPVARFNHLTKRFPLPLLRPLYITGPNVHLSICPSIHQSVTQHVPVIVREPECTEVNKEDSISALTEFKFHPSPTRPLNTVAPCPIPQEEFEQLLGPTSSFSSVEPAGTLLLVTSLPAVVSNHLHPTIKPDHLLQVVTCSHSSSSLSFTL